MHNSEPGLTVLSWRFSDGGRFIGYGWQAHRSKDLMNSGLALHSFSAHSGLVASPPLRILMRGSPMDRMAFDTATKKSAYSCGSVLPLHSTARLGSFHTSMYRGHMSVRGRPSATRFTARAIEV